MAAGRKPKPTALKKLQGNPGKRCLNGREPKPDSRLPYCPRHLPEEAKREWNRVAKELQRIGVMTFVDRAALAAYCAAWARWVEAEKALEKEEPVVTSDKGNVYQNPWVGVARQAMKDMLDAAREFGMTPSSRSRIKVEKGEEGPTLVEQLFKVSNV